MKLHLSPRELATVLGLGKNAVTRWVDDGLIAAPRTAGGHRRIPLVEAIRFIRHSAMPVLDPGPLEMPELEPGRPVEADCERIAMTIREGLMCGDGATVRRAVLTAYLDGISVAHLCDGPIAAAMAEIGELWRHGDDGIIIEHRATDLCIQALNQVRSLMVTPGHDAPVAVGGALGEDPYILPSLMVATVLADAGWHEMNLGPGTPADALALAADHCRAAMCWLSITAPRPTDALLADLRHLARQLARQGTMLLVGGRALPAESRALAMKNLYIVTTVSELRAFAHGLTRSGWPVKTRGERALVGSSTE